MIKNIDFESDCKRIAMEIQKHASYSRSDTVEVVVSKELIKQFNAEKKKYMNQINKCFNEFKVSYQTHGYGHGWFIIFNLVHTEERQ